jgi:hypothetical protein
MILISVRLTIQNHLNFFIKLYMSYKIDESVKIFRKRNTNTFENLKHNVWFQVKFVRKA